MQSNSFTHQTELFGPVLAVMRAATFVEAIEIANGTSYGLTSGLHSLDPREKDLWVQKIEAGNCYVNRGITGAIVQRQPFGGCKESSFGMGFKSGGPNSIVPLMYPLQKSLPKEKGSLNKAVESLAALVEEENFSEDRKLLWQTSASNYAYYWNCYFSKEHDPSKILGQDNILSYRPRKHFLVRMQISDDLLDLWRAIAAGVTVGCDLEVSIEKPLSNSFSRLTGLPDLHVTIVQENEEQLIQRLSSHKIKQIRLFTSPSKQLEEAFAKNACHVKIAPMLANGRIELLNFLREVSLSYNYHRYGNLGEREKDEDHTPLLFSR